MSEKKERRHRREETGGGGGGLSILDTSSVAVLVPGDPDDTPSRKGGVDADTEKLHRLHGASILAEAWQLLPQRGRLRIVPRRQRRQQQPSPQPKEEEGGDGAGNSSTDGSQQRQQSQQQLVADVAETAASCHATACTIFHRFYHRASLAEFDVWSVAAASSLLASKLDGRFDVSVERLVLVFAHVHGKRRRVWRELSSASAADDKEAAAATAGDDNGSRRAKGKRKQSPRPRGAASASSSFGFLSPMGPVYREWHDRIVETESRILRRLGLTLYWIPNQHVHKFLPFLVDLLFASSDDTNSGEQQRREEEGEDGLRLRIGRRAWCYCNDSYRLDLISRYESHLIACAAVHLSCLDCNYYNEVGVKGAAAGGGGGSSGRKIGRGLPWWEHVSCGSGSSGDDAAAFRLKFSTVCNAILGLQKQQQQRQQKRGDGDMGATQQMMMMTQQALRGYVSSLLEPPGSFSDPGGFLWEMMEGDIT